ncbi:hypothetical protein GALMADRAFT_61273 [Galerina marginata CBS 339.88]|uniref:F-box domain-containing protein n=1 Tax=Galerina marginata (strain CBS 339.88) TaxID=685588 RepID=A0A067TQ41_GALM3|nr:hypothetical protein GALMADRAFT_61273 [Galerina marginata CBS 339.88]
MSHPNTNTPSSSSSSRRRAEREKERERERDREKEREKEKGTPSESSSSLSIRRAEKKERDRESQKEKDQARDRGKERDREKGKGKERENSHQDSRGPSELPIHGNYVHTHAERHSHRRRHTQPPISHPPPQPLYIPTDRPPTPAPSPIPTTQLTSPFPPSPSLPLSGLSPSSRLHYLSLLLSSCTPSELLFISQTISPLLKRDFLKDLPPELALEVVGYLEDPRDLGRVGRVSWGWRGVGRDEGVWRRMCVLFGFWGEGWGEGADRRERRERMEAGGKGKERASEGKERDHRQRTFSFRRHFKSSYITRQNWRHGGHLLSTHRMPIVPPDTGTVTSLALDADWVVVGLAGSMIKVFSARTGVLCRTLVGHESGVWGNNNDPHHPPDAPSNMGSTSYGWGQPNSIIVSGGCDKTVRVWDAKSGQCIYVLHGHTSTIRCIRTLHSRPIAVTGSRDATLRVWDVQLGRCLRVLEGHQQSVRCLDVWGDRVVSGSYDSTCRLWNIDTGECIHVLTGHFHQVYSVAFDGTRIASGGLDTTVRVWSAETGQCIALLQGHTALSHLTTQTQTTSPSNHPLLATGGSDGRIITFSLSTYKPLHKIIAHDSSVTSLQFSSEWLVTGGNDGRVRLFETRTGVFVREVGERGEGVWKVGFGGMGEDVIAVTCKRSGKTVVEIWSMKARSGSRGGGSGRLERERESDRDRDTERDRHKDKDRERRRARRDAQVVRAAKGEGGSEGRGNVEEPEGADRPEASSGLVEL